jgi:membrane protease YdiL (CAAX protease family)
MSDKELLEYFHFSGVKYLLIGLPLISNIISFLIFVPLFTPGRMVTNDEFRVAGNFLGLSLAIVEIVGILVVMSLVHKEKAPLTSIINYQKSNLRPYFIIGLVALIPTIVLGWLFVQAQVQAGIEITITQMSTQEVILWFGIIPITTALCEELIWRGYAIPRIQGSKRKLILTSLSFAAFHGIFNPIVLVITFFQGLLWGWVYQRTESPLPSMSLHFVSRYLAIVL